MHKRRASYRWRNEGKQGERKSMLSCALYHGIFITTSWKCIRRKAHEEIISTLGDIQHKKRGSSHEKSLCCVYQNQRRKERKELIIAIVVECVVRVSEPKERPPPCDCRALALCYVYESNMINNAPALLGCVKRRPKQFE